MIKVDSFNIKELIPKLRAVLQSEIKDNVREFLESVIKEEQDLSQSETGPTPHTWKPLWEEAEVVLKTPSIQALTRPMFREFHALLVDPTKGREHWDSFLKSKGVQMQKLEAEVRGKTVGGRKLKSLSTLMS